MSFIIGPVMGLLGGTGAAAGAAATIALPGMAGAATLFPAPLAAAGAAAAGGLSLSSILEGSASVLGLVSSVAAGAAERERAELAAADADREVPIENLQALDRRRQLRAAAMEAIGEMDVAYAGSGVDLSFGSAATARTAALREADLALTADGGTSLTRLSRLTERAANYRRMGKRAMSAGLLSGLTGALTGVARIAGR